MHFNFQRLIEAGIIAIITAAGTTYITQQILTVQMTEIRLQMSEMKMIVEQMRRDLYIPRTR